MRCSDSTLYTGVTKDLDRRLLEHNTSRKGAKYTRSRRPVFSELSAEVPDRSTALKLEKAIKKLSRKEKERYISGDLCINDLRDRIINAKKEEIKNKS